MNEEPRGVTGRHVALVGLALTAGSLLIWLLNRRSGGIVPPTSWLAIALLVLIAGLVVSATWPVRNYLRGNGARRLDPLRAARALTIAQAATLTGSGAFGWYFGQVLASLADLGLVAVRGRMPGLVAALVAAGLLTGCGLWAQAMCRVDPPDDDQR
ncbi:MAG: DUF3180 domain-containing protein [Nostocoides sp.]